jgi:plastocyanin
MRRRAAGLAAVALLLAGGLLASSNGLGRAGAATTTCVWTKHTKRVVKDVKRHGRLHRVVRIRHYLTCRKVAVPEPTATTPITTALAEPTPAPTTPPLVTSEPEPEPNAVSITTDDHTTPNGYAPSHTTVKAGKLTVQLNNALSEDEHNMDMQRIGPGETPEGPVVAMLSAPGKGHSEPTTVEVQPGRYRMWCTIGHHAENGMTATITVE